LPVLRQAKRGGGVNRNAEMKKWKMKKWKRNGGRNGKKWVTPNVPNVSKI
jgi:hypothetical protein